MDSHELRIEFKWPLSYSEIRVGKEGSI